MNNLLHGKLYPVNAHTCTELSGGSSRSPLWLGNGMVNYIPHVRADVLTYPCTNLSIFLTKQVQWLLSGISTVYQRFSSLYYAGFLFMFVKWNATSGIRYLLMLNLACGIYFVNHKNGLLTISEYQDGAFNWNLFKGSWYIVIDDNIIKWPRRTLLQWNNVELTINWHKKVHVFTL